MRKIGIGLALALAALAVPAVAAARNAYVVRSDTDNVTAFKIPEHIPVAVIGVGNAPAGIAITPDGSTAYVVKVLNNNVVPIDTATNTAGAAIGVGQNPQEVAITPDGSTAYVTNRADDNVSPVDLTASPPSAGTAITVGDAPEGVAITPDGATAYVANFSDDTVTPIDTATNTAGTPIPLAEIRPERIAITPDGSTAYVTHTASDAVTPIDTATNTAGTAINVNDAAGIAITPDGATAYVSNQGQDTVTPIDTATNTKGTPIGVGDQPDGVAITPDGATAYVPSNLDDKVTPIDIASNTAGTAFTVDGRPTFIAIVPNQGPTATFDASPAIAGSPTSFDASGSSDPDGTVARYDWDFGDGTTLEDGGPTPSHTYTSGGTFTVKLTVTDDEGCSTELVFTGQTAHCIGSDSAGFEDEVTIQPDDAELAGASKDGKVVFFASLEPLAPADTDSAKDIYKRKGTGEIKPISGGTENVDATFEGTANDGSRAYFTTTEQLVAEDTDEALDLYRFTSGEIRLMSGGDEDVDVTFEGAANDGSPVYFTTTEQLVAEDGDSSQDIYKFKSGEVRLVTKDVIGSDADFEANASDGTPVIYSTPAQVVPADTDSVSDVYKRNNGKTKLLSGGTENIPATFRGASKDGKIVYFTTTEQLVAEDTDPAFDIYKFKSGEIKLVTKDVTGGFSAFFAGNANDGSPVFYETFAPVLPADGDTARDVYKRNRGNTRLLSGGTENADAEFEGASRDGKIAFFTTTEGLLGADTDSVDDVYRFKSGQIQLLSGGSENDAALFQAVSKDGKILLWVTDEQLLGADNDSNNDIYKRKGTGDEKLLSDGTENIHVGFRDASNNGKIVLFVTEEQLVAADVDDANDVYRFKSGQIQLLSD